MAGLSFAPPASPDRRSQQQNAAALSPTQQALQVLSLHLPRILGARAISPSSLLTPQTGPAAPVSPDAAVLQSALQAGRAGLGAPSSPLAPAPAAIPAAPSGGLSPTAQALAALIQSAISRPTPTPSITPGNNPGPTPPPTNGPVITTGPSAPPPPPPPAPLGGSTQPIRWGNLRF